MLVQASRRILDEIDASDILARIGGDEFIVVLTNEPRAEEISVVATRVIEALGRPFHIEGHRITIGASIGIALFPDHGADADTLMRAADAAMYRAKGEGRAAPRFYETTMNDQLRSRLELQLELALAGERDAADPSLSTHGQRHNRSGGDVRSPDPMASSPARPGPTGGVHPLGGRDGADRPDRTMGDRDRVPGRRPAGPSRGGSLSTCHQIQFRHSDLCTVIGNALAAHGLHPARVVVEITEGVLIEDAAKAVLILNRLRNMGVRVALDDFGSGFSSLSYLQLFKFDKFKIDKSFVWKLGQSEEALTIIKTIVNLGHNLGLQVTAEGVETLEQLNFLRALGCDQIQGYLVARPAPMGSFTRLDQLRTTAMFGHDRLRLSA